MSNAPLSPPQQSEVLALAAARLQEATALHGQGALEAARIGYEAVLSVMPDNVDALHRLGLVHYQMGNPQAAVPLIEQAVRLGPELASVHVSLGVIRFALDQPAAALDDFTRALALVPHHLHALNNRGNALSLLGRPADALRDFDAALQIQPDFAEAWTNRGVVLERLGRMEDALDSHDRALQIRPDYPKALNNRGHVLRELGRRFEAVASIQQALSLQPGFAMGWNNLGALQRELGQMQAALSSLERALALDPEQSGILDNLGNVLRDLGRPADALASYQLALNREPHNQNIWSNRAGALCDLRRYEEALQSCDRALELDPGHIGAWVNRANALRDLKRPEHALQSCDEALRLAPHNASAWLNRGNALLDLGRPQDALDSYDIALRHGAASATLLTNRGLALQHLGHYPQALDAYAAAEQLQPDYAQARWYASLCRLLLGDFTEGWTLYEARWQVPEMRDPHHYNAPLWLGAASLQGQTILLHAEQGLGDTLQFCRYAPLLARRGSRVILAVQPVLKSLLRNLGPNITVIALNETPPPYDYHCPLLSLPLAMGTQLSTIPAAIPYLRADPERVAQWRARLAPYPRPWIGLVWSGNPQHRNDRWRSIPLAAFAPCWTARATWVCGQNEMRAEDRDALAQSGMLDVSADLRDFEETAALFACLDRVVAVDTSGAHLAGALGRPTTLLLPRPPDFRWLLERRDSPWYPSLTLLRQSTPGNWDTVIAALAQQLDRDVS
jgi:tetratricopeptide (TPR) repeat protein